MTESQILVRCAIAVTALLACLTVLTAIIAVRLHWAAAHFTRVMAGCETLLAHAQGVATDVAWAGRKACHAVSDFVEDAVAMRRSVHQAFNRLGNSSGSGSRRSTRRQHQKGGES